MTYRTCPKTNKDKFATRLDADLKMIIIQQTHKHHAHRGYRDTPVRSYQCEFCGCWHLTSQQQRREIAS